MSISPKQYFPCIHEPLCNNFITSYEYYTHMKTKQNTSYLVLIHFRKHDKNVCQVYYLNNRKNLNYLANFIYLIN